MKKSLNYIKKKKGSHAIEVIIITPIWLFVILFCVYVQSLSKARQTLADETNVFANIISTSKSLEEAKTNVTNYIVNCDLENKFPVSKKGIDNIVKITTSTEGWKKGDIVNISVTIDTSFVGINFNKVSFAGATFNFLKTNFTNSCSIILLESEA